MKKIILGMVIGFSVVSIVVFAAEILIPATEIIFESEQTNKTNVAAAIDELFERAETISENRVNVAAPVIKERLIPVTIDDEGIVRKADVNSKWYDYGNKIWANAVELIPSAGGKYDVGQSIPSGDIRGYFVWIPKFKYRLWNVNSDGESTGSIGPHSIEIEFDTTNTTDIEGVSCATPMTSGGTGNCNNGEWMTHPAFISIGVNGFWVGKFEITERHNSTTYAKMSMKENTLTDVFTISKGLSWTSTSAEDYFNLLKLYNPSLDSHMIKNTEWGAVAYLSHSKYGKDSEINMNNWNFNTNNWYTRAGYSALPSADNHNNLGVYGTTESFNSLYNTKNGYRASTTGNISGIYDMSGGASEYVASTIWNGTDKYVDSYTTSSNDNKDYKYRILGDATGEMGPFLTYADGDESTRSHGWYGDISNFITNSTPNFVRGGHATKGSSAGIFAFLDWSGAAEHWITSRIVLSPTP